MRRRSRYRLSASRSRSRAGRLWLLVLLVLLGVGGWFWWSSREVPPPAPAAKPVFVPPKMVTPPVVQPEPPKVEPKPVQAQPPPAETKPPPPVVQAPPPRLPPKVEVEPPPATTFPRPVRDVFEAQLALARLDISSGSLDGLMGSQTRAALRAFQLREHLPITGELDAVTKERLVLATPPYASFVVSTNDLARLQPLSSTWLGKSQQTALDYETLLELVAEKSHSHPKLIRRLNPMVAWTNVAACTVLRVPDVACSEPASKAAFISISLSNKVLQVFNADSNLVAHFPCSIAQRVEKRPVGELHVAAIAPNPNYTFDPEVFPESVEARQLKTKLILPPGPNNPVGVAWISLDKPGYGIHGTPSPEQVGRTESHGCFRLANWNAEHLIKLVTVGIPVYIQP